MSISYGNFSQALKHAVSSGVVASGSSVYFQIPWEAASYVSRIRIWSSDNTNRTIDSMQIATDLGHVIDGSLNNTFYFLYSDDTSVSAKAKSGYAFPYNINPEVHHTNLYNRPYLSVRAVFSADISSNPTFYCLAEGRKAYSTNYERTDHTNVNAVPDYRVLLGKGQTGSGGTGGIIYDVSKMSIHNTVNANTNIFNVESSNDYIYVGSNKRITHWEINIGSGSTTATAIKGEIWSGTAWTTYKVLDGTRSTLVNTLRYSGLFEGSGLASSTWPTTKLDPELNIRLPNDPLTVLEKSIKAGSTNPISMLDNNEKYWSRFSFTGLADKVQVTKILPIEEEYSLF